MTLATANAYAASLASTLMVVIIIFRAGDGTMSVMPAAEYDGDDDTIVFEIDPFGGRRRMAGPRTVVQASRYGTAMRIDAPEPRHRWFLAASLGWKKQTRTTRIAVVLECA